MKRVRTALIGCGKVGGLHAAALSSLPESNLVAMCDADAARAGQFAAQYGGDLLQAFRKCFRTRAPEAVFICTPHPLHAEPAVLAANSGAHVMIEKPMAASLA